MRGYFLEAVDGGELIRELKTITEDLRVLGTQPPPKVKAPKKAAPSITAPKQTKTDE